MNSVKTNDILGHKENLKTFLTVKCIQVSSITCKAEIKNIHLKKIKKNTASIEILKILTYIIVVCKGNANYTYRLLETW